MPGLNPFPFVLSSSCITSYLPLNPAFGCEFSREFSLCGVFPNTQCKPKQQCYIEFSQADLETEY
jgi:hypothetical protein